MRHKKVVNLHQYDEFKIILPMAMRNAKVKLIEYKERQKDKVIYYVYIDRSTFFIFYFKAKLQGSKPIAVDSL